MLQSFGPDQRSDRVEASLCHATDAFDGRRLIEAGRSAVECGGGRSGRGLAQPHRPRLD
jgi:hypothetical protein